MDPCKDNAHLDEIKRILENQPEAGPKPINIQKYTKPRSKFQTYKVSEKPEYFEKSKRGGQKIKLANEIKNLKNELLPVVEKHNLDKIVSEIKEKQKLLNKLRHKNRDKKRIEQYKCKYNESTNKATNMNFEKYSWSSSSSVYENKNK